MSILFAAPDTAVVAGLQRNLALYDARSGHMWDLYIAGYYAYGERDYDPDGTPLGGDASDPSAVGFLGHVPVRWWFSPREFVALSSAIASAHADSLARVPMLRGRRTPWKYSGTPEIVNLWASGRTPDWESLVANEVAEQGPSALGGIVESHTDWRTESLPHASLPGTRRREVSEVLHADALERGLSWAVAGAAGAVVAEGATALVEAVIRAL